MDLNPTPKVTTKRPWEYRPYHPRNWTPIFQGFLCPLGNNPSSALRIGIQEAHRSTPVGIVEPTRISARASITSGCCYLAKMLNLRFESNKRILLKENDHNTHTPQTSDVRRQTTTSEYRIPLILDHKPWHNFRAISMSFTSAI